MAPVPQPYQWHMLASGNEHRPTPQKCAASKLMAVLFSFAEKIIRAAKGEKGIVEPTYVYLPGVPGGEEIAKETGVDYFSVPVELGVRAEHPSSTS